MTVAEAGPHQRFERAIGPLLVDELARVRR